MVCYVRFIAREIASILVLWQHLTLWKLNFTDKNIQIVSTPDTGKCYFNGMMWTETWPFLSSVPSTKRCLFRLGKWFIAKTLDVHGKLQPWRGFQAHLGIHFSQCMCLNLCGGRVTFLVSFTLVSREIHHSPNSATPFSQTAQML